MGCVLSCGSYVAGHFSVCRIAAQAQMRARSKVGMLSFRKLTVEPLTALASSSAKASRCSGRPSPPCGGGNNSARGWLEARSPEPLIKPGEVVAVMGRVINQRVVAQRLPDRVLRGRGGTDLEVRLRLRHVAGTRRERRGAGPGRTGLGRQPPLLLVPFPHRFTPRR